jgi:spore coat protein CotH
MKSFRFYFLLIVVIFFSCQKAAEEEIIPSFDQLFSTPDWTEATHGKVDPNYETVFPQDKVNSIELTMTKEDWSLIQSNITTLFGFSFGASGQQAGGGSILNEDPDYVSLSVKFNNREWYKVGFRLKGNSSLKNSWRQGIYKLPFRLKMDRFEDDYPQIKNQRFYGFKELSFSPGANDNSLIREKVGSDIFRSAGIPCAQTAFYRVYINFGDGLKYCGVYTVVEVVDDTLIEGYFGNDSGNIYKPESTFQSFIQSQFEKKNNESANDYSDVQNTISILNSTLRTSDPVLWREKLETDFDADHFMKWLAVNTAMLNWDTYGRMAHNYYLYNLTGSGLTWIPWDNNECMLNRTMNNASTYSISLSTSGSNWPLIRYLMDDPVYLLGYKYYMKEFTETVFKPEEMSNLFDYYHNLISPYVIGPLETEQGKYTHLSNQASFTSELEKLKQHVVSQNLLAAEYLK